MGCFPCSGDGDTSVKKPEKKIFQTISNHKYKRVEQPQPKQVVTPVASQFKVVKNEDAKVANRSMSKKDVGYSNISPTDGKTGGAKAQRFKFDQLIAATEDFKEDYFLGEGGFGKVYKGHLEDTGEIVAIKQLDPNGCQGVREFVVEVQTLSKADHANLVKLIGCCAEGDQRLLVYEYMSLGSLEDHLFDPWPNQKPLDWNVRMKIAAGAARGLEYLHDKMNPPIIYRDLKCSNILLGEGFHPKLSDFGLAKVGPSGDKTHVSTRVMGTYGYCAPDYAMTGQLTFKSDIYSFGVVLLEIITGRRAIDYTKSATEQNLVSWARPLFKDRKKFYKMADPALDGHYPIRSLYQALAIAAMCVQEQPNMRPPIVDIVTALSYLASLKYDPEIDITCGAISAFAVDRIIRGQLGHLLAKASSKEPEEPETTDTKNIGFLSDIAGPKGTQLKIVYGVFGYMQVLSACFMSFAHGGNDVSNAIGPLAAALSILQGGLSAADIVIPNDVLAWGGFGIVAGLTMWGYRVIATIGKKITELTPTRGFAAEFAAASVVLCASKLGLPISGTHTLVGAVMGVGFARGFNSVRAETVREIATSWAVTIPAGATFAVIYTWIFTKLLSYLL